MQQRLALQAHALPGQLQATGRQGFASNQGRALTIGGIQHHAQQAVPGELLAQLPVERGQWLLFSMVHRRRWDQRCSLLVNLACSVCAPGPAKHCGSSWGGALPSCTAPLCAAAAHLWVDRRIGQQRIQALLSAVPVGSRGSRLVGRDQMQRATSWRSTCGQSRQYIGARDQVWMDWVASQAAGWCRGRVGLKRVAERQQNPVQRQGGSPLKATITVHHSLHDHQGRVQARPQVSADCRGAQYGGGGVSGPRAQQACAPGWLWCTFAPCWVAAHMLTMQPVCPASWQRQRPGAPSSTITHCWGG